KKKKQGQDGYFQCSPLFIHIYYTLCVVFYFYFYLFFRIRLQSSTQRSQRFLAAPVLVVVSLRSRSSCTRIPRTPAVFAASSVTSRALSVRVNFFFSFF